MRRFMSALGLCGAVAAAMTISARSVEAWACDFLTGGGFIFTTAGGNGEAKGTFAIGGGCKHGSPTWGHLEYHDHGNGLNAHWTSITGYFERDTSADPKTGQPIGTRYICGTARTNLYGDVDFAVRATDNGEPGTSDEFVIRLTKFGVTMYTTEGDDSHQLGGGEGGGGNIQLHKPNPSTTGDFGGSCPAAPEVQ
jgi:hypothetical protein